jgi:hypothetical protein
MIIRFKEWLMKLWIPSAKSKADKPRELLKLLAVTSTEGDLLRGLGSSDIFEGVTGSLG